MPRYIKAKGRRPRSADALSDQLLRELESEGKKILKKLTAEATNDFLGSLQSEGGKFLQNLAASGGSAGGENPLDSISPNSFGNLFQSLINNFVFRPKASTRMRETARSKETEELFRLSRRQALAEAGMELGKGEKNL